MPTPIRRRCGTVFLSLAVMAAATGAAMAQKKYDTGASDTEIKIGNIVPLMQFKGERWQLFGDVISGELAGN
jgi:hypothetical protein